MLTLSHQPNVGLSCEPREQAERRVSDALRSVGVRQIQALVGWLFHGPCAHGCATRDAFLAAFALHCFGLSETAFGRSTSGSDSHFSGDTRRTT